MDCKYHDTKKASWHCDTCNTPFCMDCIEVEPNTIASRCLLCRNYLTRMGMSEQVEPFWNRLNFFNRYPFQEGAKSFLMFYAAISLVLGFLIAFIPFGFAKLILHLALLAILVSYVFSVLSRTAKGDFIAPKYDQTVTYDADGMTMKIIGLFLILFIGGIGIARGFGGTGLVLYQVGLAFLMPAILVILGMSKQLSSALNPGIMLSTIVAIGFPYLILSAFAVMIYFSMDYATGVIEYWLPDPVVFFISKSIEAFFYIILFHMLGYVVYQYHAELGYGVDLEKLATNENIQLKPELRALAHADVYIQEGRYEDAKNELLKAGENAKYQEQAYSKMVKLYIATNEPVEMIKAAKLYYENPELHLNGFNAWQLYSQIKKVEPRFRPMNATARLVLITQIRNKSLKKELVYLTEDLEAKFGDDNKLAAALLAEIKFYADIEQNDALAIQKLEHLLAQYPKGEHRLEAEELLKAFKAFN